MIKLVVLCCVFVAATASAPFYVSPVAIPVPSPFGYAVPLQNHYNTAHHTANAFNNGFHVLNKRSATRLPVVPGVVGFSAAVANGNIAIDPTGFTAAIATNPIGIPSSLATGSLGITTPIVDGSVGFSAGPALVSAIPAGSISVSSSPVFRI